MSPRATSMAAGPNVARKSKLKTYSRRHLTRRMSSPLVPMIAYYEPRLTQSFSAMPSQPKTPTKKNARQPDFSVPGPKRVRFSGSDHIEKSPTELFFEMISSSAPGILQPQQEGREEEVVLPSTEVEDDDLEENGDSPDEPVKPVSLCGDMIKVEAAGSEEPVMMAELEELTVEDDGDNDELGEEFSLNEQSNDPIQSSPVTITWQSSPHMGHRAQTVSKTRGRFLTFKKADDRDDFKSIEKRPENHMSKRLSLKISKRTSDGFNEDEKHASPLRKQRRIRGDTRIGSLELTQSGAFTQNLQGPTWPRGEKKTRTTTISSLWSRRQYVGSAQAKSESQDLLYSFDEETEPLPKNEARSGSRKARQISIEDPSDADEVDLLVFPPDDVDDDDIEKGNDEVAFLVESDELGEEADVDSFVVPRTDTPSQDVNIALGDRSEFYRNKRPENRLPPKRQWHRHNTSAFNLALRPDVDDGWPLDAQKMPETPLARKHG